MPGKMSVEPRVLGINQPVRLKVRPGEDFTFAGDLVYYAGRPCRLRLFGRQYAGSKKLGDSTMAYEVNVQEKTVLVEVKLPLEQEYNLAFYYEQDSHEHLAATGTIYALEADLLACLPWKGDLHMHSNRSDGRDEPDHVVAACRRIGFDFMALTDHGQFAPSLATIATFADVETDLAVYTGEEVHAPGNPIHIVHVGGKNSVNDCFATTEYKEELARLVQEQGPVPAGIDPAVYASSRWIWQRIAKEGGLSIFCHPYWENRNPAEGQSYYISEQLTTRLFEDAEYDALEVLGGYHMHQTDSNNLQLARYHEERARGRVIPIVGVSDAHGCETGSLFGWFYTIALADTNGFTDIATAIRQCRSVAVEALPGEVVRVYGPFRLVKYVLFLLREYFPEHDRLCFTEGLALHEYIANDADKKQVAAKLARLKGRVRSLQNRPFAR